MFHKANIVLGVASVGRYYPSARFSEVDIMEGYKTCSLFDFTVMLLTIKQQRFCTDRYIYKILRYVINYLQTPSESSATVC